MIGDVIKRERELLELSQSELAKKLNVSQRTVASWEINRTEPSVGFICMLSDMFGVSIDYLIGKEKNRERAVLIYNLTNDTEEFKTEFLKQLIKNNR